jgi:hypothetical protein
MRGAFLTAGHDDDVERRMVVEGSVGQQPHALAAADRLQTCRHEQHPVGRCAPTLEQRRRGGEDLPRTGDVELLRAVEDQHPDRAHVATVTALGTNRP